MNLMPPIKSFDHIGITVADLDAVTAFFVRLGLEVDGRMFVEGDFVATVTGIPDSRTEIVGLRAPGGGTWICLLYTSPSPRDLSTSRMPSSA